MSIEVETGLDASIERAVTQSIQATRVTNLLLIAQSMGLDATNPTQRGRALRQLELIENEVERNG